MRSKRFLPLALVLFVVAFALACRTADTIVQLSSRSGGSSRAATRRPTRVAVDQPVRQDTPIVAVTDIPFAQPPTNEPTSEDSDEPTVASPPTSRPPPPQVKPTDPPPATPVPQPTTPQFLYRIQESRCGPNVRTYIEGTVYEGSVGKNDVLVRISQGPDGGPDPNDDYRTGTDPRRKGYYYHNIDANAPHDGTWYIWVLDKDTLQRISEIAIVKTDATRVEDSGSSAGSCQSATVNFSTTGPKPPSTPTNTPRPTDSGGQQPSATPRPTQDMGDDS